MRAVVERAHAKINLHLRILARAADGYHELETLFQALELSDTLEARVADATALEVAGDVDTGPAGRNLVLEAARAFGDAVPDAAPVAFRLTKRIPAAAGLGGGSSDAAAALRALNTLAGDPLSTDALRELGATLGADVAFFLCGSPLAWATGRGEKLMPRPPLPAAPVLVVDPGFPVATRDAFAWWDARHPAERRPPGAAPIATRFAQFAGAVGNDFEEVVFDRHPQLARIRDALAGADALIAMLSGSGSCVYGLFDEDAELRSAQARVLEVAPRATVLRTRTLAHDDRPR